MPQPRKIYLLDPHHLNPETIAVTFAKTSRSPRSFQEIADELSDEKSAEFNEKWVVGYGHSSVAEHAVLHIALENISRLAVECLESNRLASYTEKSSRYQVWDSDHFYVPAELAGHKLEKDYIAFNKRFFEHYKSAIDKVSEHLKCSQDQQEGESDQLYNQRIKTSCADVSRYFLPASALANVGMTINARALEHAIDKLLSHPLEEVKEIGREIKATAQKSVPTLVKYANENPYLEDSEFLFRLQEDHQNLSTSIDEGWFNCVQWDKDGEARILSALLFRFEDIPIKKANEIVKGLSPDKKRDMAYNLLGRLGEHDIPLREMEYASITFETKLDQGAYFELKRHRMMTLTPQKLTANHGFALPSLLEKAGIVEQFKADMSDVQTFYKELSSFNSNIASYVVPNAFNRRVLIQMNLRSAFHFVNLRSAPNAHFAIRRLALRTGEEICKQYPLFAEYFKPATNETWQTITSKFFAQLA